MTIVSKMPPVELLLASKTQRLEGSESCVFKVQARPRIAEITVSGDPLLLR